MLRLLFLRLFVVPTAPTFVRAVLNWKAFVFPLAMLACAVAAFVFRDFASVRH